MSGVRKIPSVAMAFVLLALAALVAGTLHAQVKVDPALPVYKAVQGVSGSIKSVGSDTMNNLMTLWAEGFRKFYPSVQVEIEGKGSGTAPPALIAGTSNFGPMSRKMKSRELDEFRKKFKFDPVALPTSIDMVAVYVNKDNPIQGLSLQQVDAIFSRTRKGGHDHDVRTWGDAGLEGDWADLPISLYGRNAASGTYGFFKTTALFKGDYRNEVKEQPGSSSVVQGVARDRAGVGYSGIGYRTADVKVVPLGKRNGDAFVPAEPENGYSGKYPLSRFLYLYVNTEPGKALDPLRREFIRFIFSRQGQEAVVRDGYLPVTAKIAGKALAQVGLSLVRP